MRIQAKLYAIFKQKIACNLSQNKRNKHSMEEQAIVSIHRTLPDGKSRTQNVSKAKIICF